MTKALQKKLTRLLASPAVVEKLASVEDEAEVRPLRITSTVTLNVPAELGTDERPLDCFPAGAITAFVAEAGNPALLSLANAIPTRDATSLKALLETVRQNHDLLDNVLQDTVIDVAAVPVYADIRYRTKTLVSHVVINKSIPMQVHIFPYNGGTLDDTQFTLVEHYRPGTTQALAAILVKRQPILTPIEKEALRQVPGDLSEVHVSSALPTPRCRTAVTVAIVTAAAVTFAVVAQHGYDAGHAQGDAQRAVAGGQADAVGIDDRGGDEGGDRGEGTGSLAPGKIASTAHELLKRLRPAPTAGELLQARREMLKRKGN